jgi:hypothetical protein
MSENTKSRGDTEWWRERALALGVDPDEPDDFKYFSRLERAEGLISSFEYHQPSEGQIERIAAVRSHCIECAKGILRSTPMGPDQTAALRKLHECMMTANKAIVCELPQ